jgi:hypothetical protein
LDAFVLLVWFASDAVVDAASEASLALLSLDGRPILAVYSRDRGASTRWRLGVALWSVATPAALATDIPDRDGRQAFDG